MNSDSGGVGAHFDLVDESWIPVMRDGRAAEVSLRDAVVQAHLIDGIAATDGPQFAGILRLLMALVMDAYGRPATSTHWQSMWAARSFDAATLDAYVSGVGRQRFDLFDADRPFLQSAATPAEGKSIAEIVPHIAVGNNPALFTPDTDRTPRSLSPAEAARTLIASQAVALPNLGRAPTDESNQSWKGVSFAGRVGNIGFVAPVGRSLFDTLLLNIPAGINPAGDRPSWARDQPPPPGRYARAATGMLDLLTWTPRRVRLLPGTDGQVSRIAYRGGDGLLALAVEHEPHTALRTSDGQGQGAPPAGTVYPRKHLSHSLGWRGLPSLLALAPSATGNQAATVFRDLATRDLPADYPIGVAGLYVEFGNMNAVYTNLIFDVYPLPARSFGPDEAEVREVLVSLVSRADVVRQKVRAFARRAAAAALHDNGKDSTSATSYAATIERRFVAEIDSITRRMLAGITREPHRIDEGETAWNLATYDAAMRFRDEIRDFVANRSLDGPDPYPYAESDFHAACRLVLPDAAETRHHRPS